MRKALKKWKGFTLAELIVVISILAILATVGFLALSGYSSDAKNTAVAVNVRTVYSAIMAESATSGNSPRYYVVHDSSAALSWAIMVVDGNSTTLTWGDWNVAGTNYSAGNPNYARLKINPEKFKVSSFFRTMEEAFAAYDPNYLSVGAAEFSTTSASGRKHVTNFVQAAGLNPSGKVTVTGNYPLGVSGSAAGLVRDQASPSSTGALVDNGTSTGTLAPMICPTNYTGSDCTTKLLTFTSDKKNLNVYTECVALFGSCSTGNVKVVIGTGANVFSDNVDNPSLITGAGWGAGIAITVENYGNIIGARYPSKVDRTTNRAYDGGTALYATVQTSVINYGNIIGGSGSGGPGEGDSCGGCGGGNGGTWGGNGGAAIDARFAMSITNNGAIYGGGGGGAGGGGAFAAGVGSGPGGNGAGGYLTTITATAEPYGACWVACWGNGGTYGQAGAGGGNAGNGAGNGGVWGYSIVLNGKSVTYNGAAVVANASYTESTWLPNTKGRIGS